MADKSQTDERMVSMIITIRIDSIPLSEAQKIEEEALRVGDEWGADTDINKGAPRGLPLQG